MFKKMYLSSQAPMRDKSAFVAPLRSMENELRELLHDESIDDATKIKLYNQLMSRYLHYDSQWIAEPIQVQFKPKMSSTVLTTIPTPIPTSRAPVPAPRGVPPTPPTPAPRGAPHPPPPTPATRGSPAAFKPISRT